MVWVATTISVVTRCGVQLTGDEMRMAGWAGLDGNVGLGKGKYRTHKSCIGVCAYMHIFEAYWIGWANGVVESLCYYSLRRIMRSDRFKRVMN